MNDLFDDVEEILAGDLSSHPVMKQLEYKFREYGATFARGTYNKLYSSVTNACKAIATKRGATLSDEEIEESYAFREAVMGIMSKVVEGMETAWPGPLA